MATTQVIGFVGYTDKGDWMSGYTSIVDGTTYTGYDQNDIVHTAKGIYVSLADGNVTNPDTDTTGWQTWVDTSKLDAATTKATEAAQEASNCDLTYADDKLSITGRDGTTKTVDLASAADIESIVSDAKRASLALGHYSDRTDITLTATETGVAISSDGVKVSKSGWAIAEFTAEKGNEYLFNPGVTDGTVCVFAEYIDKVEDRAIDYTYTYNADGTVATAQATYGGATHKYTYTYDAGGTATIKDASGNVVSSLPLLYTTTVGSYSPLVRLNADAELPSDGYCRFMSHFQGNNSLKVVVSYKVGSADLTMKVLRDGVFASISTQLGNIAQKLSDTASELAKMQESYVDVRPREACSVTVDGKSVALEAMKFTRLYPKLSLQVGNKSVVTVKAGRLDTSAFTSFQNFFRYCSSLAALDVSGWDTSNVTNMGFAFYSCSALATLDVSGWDTSNVTNMGFAFSGCSALATLDVSGWDTSNVTNMGFAFSGCSALATLDVSGWDVSNVTTMNDFVRETKKLTKLDVSGWDTSKVTGYSWAFSGSGITALENPKLVQAACTTLARMFYCCSALATLDVSGWDTSNVKDFQWMFQLCSGLTTLDMTSWDMGSATNVTSMFNAASNLTSLIGTHTLAEVEAGTVVAMKNLALSFSLSQQSKLDRASLLAVIKGLADLTSGTSQTLTLGSTLKAKLTSDDIAIATAKNWVIA